MICGNEEAVIQRCLESALPCFDELCLVRAVGNQAPDATKDIAEAFCKLHRKNFRFSEYVNGRTDWPHVDNFAAARNQSFSLATSDWLLWLDCDDYLDEENARRIRAATEVAKDADAVFANYRIADKGGIVSRERLIRRGKGHWKGVVHETCVVDGKALACEAITVFHGDPAHKVRKSADRNLRLLRAATENVERNLFYLHSELMQGGHHEEAAQAARMALAVMPATMIEERYITLLNLAQCDEQNREKLLLEALQLQPHRREAPAELSQFALAQGRLSDAQSWFRICVSLPEPSPLPWTHRGMWYGWAARYLNVRLLRATGYEEKAQELHAKHLADPEYAAEVKEYEELRLVA